MTLKGLETIWITLRSKRMPRSCSHIILGVIYHPPSNTDRPLINHILRCVDTIRQSHPYAGIMLTGDFNRLNDGKIKAMLHTQQLVKKSTRNDAILDKLFVSMPEFYEEAVVESPVGSSDHNVIV